MAIWNADPAVANLAEVLTDDGQPGEGAGHAGRRADRRPAHPGGDDRRDRPTCAACVRAVLWDTGALTTSKSEKLAEGQGQEYKDYFQFKEPIRHIPPHRILAINRGEKENALTVKLEWDAETGRRVALERLPLPLPGEQPLRR